MTKPRSKLRFVPLLIVGGVVSLVLLAGSFGGVSLTSPGMSGYGPSTGAVADIPPFYLGLYQQAGQKYGLDWAVLAGIGSIETDHGRSTAPGVRSGVNAYGCCAGPMQFSLVGSPSTWDRYGAGGSVYDPAAAIPAAARYLRASGAPGNYHAAIFAYNHAEWYVAEVLAKADEYRGAWRAGGPGPAGGTVAQLLADHSVVLTPVQRADLLSGGIDSRVVDTLLWIGQRHTVIVTALRHDHSAMTTSGNASNHGFGRAVDIGSVDGQVCSEAWGHVSWQSACSRLALALAAVRGPTRSTELIWCGDPDGPLDPRGFARPDHCNHVHVGWDG